LLQRGEKKYLWYKIQIISCLSDDQLLQNQKTYIALGIISTDGLNSFDFFRSAAVPVLIFSKMVCRMKYTTCKVIYVLARVDNIPYVDKKES